MSRTRLGIALLIDQKDNSGSDESEVCRHVTNYSKHKMNYAKPNILSNVGD